MHAQRIFHFSFASFFLANRLLCSSRKFLTLKKTRSVVVGWKGEEGKKRKIFCSSSSSSFVWWAETKPSSSYSSLSSCSHGFLCNVLFPVTYFLRRRRRFLNFTHGESPNGENEKEKEMGGGFKKCGGGAVGFFVFCFYGGKKKEFLFFPENKKVLKDQTGEKKGEGKRMFILAEERGDFNWETDVCLSAKVRIVSPPSSRPAPSLPLLFFPLFLSFPKSVFIACERLTVLSLPPILLPPSYPQMEKKKKKKKNHSVI